MRKENTVEEKPNLLDFNIEELQKIFVENGYEKFRAKQVFIWLNKGISSIDEMTNISKELKNWISTKFNLFKLEIFEKHVSKIDGTVKYIFTLYDGNVIESVLMQYKHGQSACISSQVGCKMGCKFCASTGAGFIRHLSPGEMLDQILVMQKDSGTRISNIVIMGIGEPLDNYENVVKFLHMVNEDEGVNIGMRHISLSTCGLIPGIMRLLKENIPITLSISLHAPNDKVRDKLMPINKRYSIDKIIEACKIYTEESKRRITFEYAMIADINDSKENAAELASKIKGMLCHVNLIPVNTVKYNDFKRSSQENIDSFLRVLEKNHIEATVRRELGSDIAAACGQLRRNVIQNT